jgi:hypothetical protein
MLPELLPMERIYWRGTHATLGWGACVGKIHRDGLRLLRENGWREVAQDYTAAVPAFSWATRRALDLPATGPGLPLVRALPQHCTGAVDDKLRLAELLAAGGCADMMPETHTAPQRTLLLRPDDRRLWFVKHRFGVKGQAVRPMHGEALGAWLAALPASCGDFVVQAEVPPALFDGRKFAMRLHVLLACRAGGAPPAAWVHRDALVLPHAAPYDAAGTGDRAAHISQAGRRHPPPCTTAELPPDHPAADHAALWPLLRALVRRSLDAARGALLPAARCERSTLYALMAYDVALRADGTPLLLEINSHPAINDGTMSGVKAEVYTRLVQDVLTLLVLPALEEGRPAVEGGFEAVEGWG